MESTFSELYEKLAAPFPVDKIHWRVGATNQDKTQGIALAYIDARDVMERLDEVVGPQNWQAEYPFPGCCRIGIHIMDLRGEPTGKGSGFTDGWVWKANGAGETDFEGEKGQFSDAFKRAAVLWGVGRYLYALPNAWVPIEQKGRSHVIKTPPKLPAWANPLGDIRNVEVSQQHTQQFKEILEGKQQNQELTLYCFSRYMGADRWSTLYNSFPDGQKVAMKRRVDDLCQEGAAIFRNYVDQFDPEDDLWIQQTQNELGDRIFNMIREEAQR